MELVSNLVRSRKSNGRRVYEPAVKRELVRRCLEPGVSVAGIALAHGLNANLLCKWITLEKPRRDSRASDLPRLLPVTTRPAAMPVSPTAGHLEIKLSRGTLRVHGCVERVALEH